MDIGIPTQTIGGILMDIITILSHFFIALIVASN